ncbi:MAG: hypothetical protein KGI59_01935 [Patescibacteria group bacterium]|nr:hypothetical protein [Patescibacteria group bacterium]
MGLGILAGLIALIVIVLKGYSLWYAARRGEKIWFVALLIVNTVGILELIYLIFIVKKWHHTIGTPSSPSTPPAQM